MDTTPNQPHRNSNTHRAKNNTTNVVIRELQHLLFFLRILNKGGKSDLCKFFWPPGLHPLVGGGVKAGSDYNHMCCSLTWLLLYKLPVPSYPLAWLNNWMVRHLKLWRWLVMIDWDEVGTLEEWRVGNRWWWVRGGVSVITCRAWRKNLRNPSIFILNPRAISF